MYIHEALVIFYHFQYNQRENQKKHFLHILSELSPSFHLKGDWEFSERKDGKKQIEKNLFWLYCAYTRVSRMYIGAASYVHTKPMTKKEFRWTLLLERDWKPRELARSGVTLFNGLWNSFLSLWLEKLEYLAFLSMHLIVRDSGIEIHRTDLVFVIWCLSAS